MPTKRKTQAEFKPNGAPTKLTEDLRQIIIALARLGHTEAEIGTVIGVTRQTLFNWRKKDPDCFYTIKRAKLQADTKVMGSLYRRANGYEYTETRTERIVLQGTRGKGKEKIDVAVPATRITETTKEVVPDTAAAFIWLKNRMPESWQDKTIVDNNLSAARPIQLIFPTE